MAPEWAPERVVDVGLAELLVHEQFPALRGLPVRPFAAGWDNVVHAVGPDLLFRFVQRAIAVPGAVRELAVLRRLAGRLPLPVPEPRYVGRPSAAFDWPFWGGPLLRGQELAVAPPTAADVPLAGALGAFLRALHDPALGRDVAAGAAADGAPLPVDPMRRADATHTAGRARERLGRLAAARVDLPYGRLEGVLRSATGIGAPATTPVLVHGDLHLRHVLVDATGRAAGVIDWGDCSLGYPATDLAVGWIAFEAAAREAFAAAYGGIRGEDVVRARVLGVHLCAALLEHAQAEGDVVRGAAVGDALRRLVG